jgi:hypothetical protein
VSFMTVLLPAGPCTIAPRLSIYPYLPRATVAPSSISFYAASSGGRRAWI